MAFPEYVKKSHIRSENIEKWLNGKITNAELKTKIKQKN